MTDEEEPIGTPSEPSSPRQDHEALNIILGHFIEYMNRRMP